ncbi:MULTISPECIES: ML domain-containing protein [unclassified Streptomyces]|uniref:ML domain-containing protein n=1 Tax=unclassified Streptomyces TaxID=2593676 RepID=UPI002250FBCE|nr:MULTISPECIES: ML domain-containing protein [unclassified Streptomyces]MCX4529916.1 ML domain-containing protein [Streptomyces sp. NBC_01551]MCX4546856.1 ML domain-containing protein [Streptomyces sp. NBC_01565]
MSIKRVLTVLASGAVALAGTLASPANPAVAASCRPVTGHIVFDCGSPTDVFRIRTVSINPDTPRKGHKATLTAQGDLREDIPAGTNMHVTARLGILTVVDKDYDFLSNVTIDQQDKQATITKETSIPGTLPSGNYLVDVVITTPARKQVARLQIKLKL